LVIDLTGVKTKLTQDQITVNHGDVKGVRMHQHPDKVRIVFDLGKYEGHRVLSQKRTQAVEISLGYSSLAGSVIVIDPGHGGSDPGAVGAKGTFEKNINLAVALKVAALLKGAGAKVVMTRDSDVYPTLGERVDIANQLNADIFVSIHCNSLKRVDPGGTEIFVAPRSALTSMALAQAIQKNLVKQIGLFDRGVKSNEFYVLNHTNMPSVLVELAFISKEEEEALLNDPAFQDKAAMGIYEGIRSFFTQTSESRGGKK
jgi:N-acetylmuramoyl-L-alanine amidase